jgi:hypothetical protein
MPIPADYRDFFILPCELTFWDLLGREFQADVSLSMLRAPQQAKPCVSRGSGLYGLDATGKPRECSIEEDARRRYLELLAQEKLAKQQRVQR